MRMKWSEILPDSCPPEDALIPHGESFYRVSHGNPAEVQISSPSVKCQETIKYLKAKESTNASQERFRSSPVLRMQENC